MVPLAENTALGIAILSYNGQLNFGLVADYDALADVEVLADELRSSIEELAAAAGGVGPPPRPPRRRRGGARGRHAPRGDAAGAARGLGGGSRDAAGAAARARGDRASRRWRCRSA